MHERGPHGRNLRKGRFSESGRPYVITTVTWDRVPHFRDLAKARCVVGALMEAQRRHLADTLAYVVMPDHLHWLLGLGETHTLSKVVGRVKSVIAHRIGGRIWQPGFHDHALRRDEDIVDVARYVVANPLRAGLVKSLWDYPHWDAAWL